MLLLNLHGVVELDLGAQSAIWCAVATSIPSVHRSPLFTSHVDISGCDVVPLNLFMSARHLKILWSVYMYIYVDNHIYTHYSCKYILFEYSLSLKWTSTSFPRMARTILGSSDMCFFCGGTDPMLDPVHIDVPFPPASSDLHRVSSEKVPVYHESLAKGYLLSGGSG